MNNFDKEYKAILEKELLYAARTNDLKYLFDLFLMIAEIKEGEENEEQILP